MVEETAPVAKSPEPPKKSAVKRAVVILILLAVLFLLAKYVVPQALVYLTRATKSTKYSLSNSYVFGSPLVCKADGKTKSRINVFLLNDQGLGVPDKQISIRSQPKDSQVSGNVEISDSQPTTDQFGKSVFEVTSQSAGQFEIIAQIEGVDLPQTVTLTFR